MSAATPLFLAFVGDDFTGSTDALEQLSLAGLRTALFTSVPTAAELSALGPLDAFGVAGNTRSLAPDVMAAQLRPVFRGLQSLGPRHVHYKVCSTFDSSPSVGSIGCAIEIGADVFGARFVPLAVGAPPLGRYCAFGNLFARFGIGSTGEIHRLDRHPVMSRHPVTPANEADLRVHLARQTEKRIGLIDFTQLDGSFESSEAALQRAVNDGAEIVLFDALTTGHLLRIGELLEHSSEPGRPLFSVGSSAIEMALGAAGKESGAFTRRTDWPVLAEARPLLVLSGSCSSVTAGQIARAEAEGFALVALETAAVLRGETGPIARAAATVASLLRAGHSTILHTSRGEIDPALAAMTAAERGAVGAVLGVIGRTILAQVAVRRLVIAGGDSSSYAAKTLGIAALSFVAPLTPGAPVCRAFAPASPVDGIEIAFKGGQVGAEDYFGRVARGR